MKWIDSSLLTKDLKPLGCAVYALLKVKGSENLKAVFPDSVRTLETAHSPTSDDQRVWAQTFEVRREEEWTRILVLDIKMY